MSVALARMAALLAASAARPLTTSSAAKPMAVGWATVELDRAAAELAGELAIAPIDFEPAADDAALGARCRLAPGPVALSGRQVRVVLLEPATEGRLAATLARHGEGPVALWLALGDRASLDGAIADLQAHGIDVGAIQSGPLGPARLILDSPPWSGHRLLVVDRAGTIAP